MTFTPLFEGSIFRSYFEHLSSDAEGKISINMENQRLIGEDYLIELDSPNATVKFTGELSLGGPTEYTPIKDLLESTTIHDPDNITIDLRELSFLNSSGISMLSKFVIGLRKNKKVQLIILGSEQIPWQKKSLKNLQKFLPTLKLEIN